MKEKLIKFNIQQLVFLTMLITMHNEANCTYVNSRSLWTKAIFDSGKYSKDLDGDTFSRVIKEYKLWKSENIKGQRQH